MANQKFLNADQFAKYTTRVMLPEFSAVPKPPSQSAAEQIAASAPFIVQLSDPKATLRLMREHQ